MWVTQASHFIYFLQCRLLEVEHAHNAEKTRLLQNHASQLVELRGQLKEEREQRERMEQLVRSQRDVAIAIDDTGPARSASGGGVAETSGDGEPKTLGANAQYGGWGNELERGWCLLKGVV